MHIVKGNVKKVNTSAIFGSVRSSVRVHEYRFAFINWHLFSKKAIIVRVY